MSIRVTLCLVVLSLGSFAGELVQDAAENHPIVVTESERKASVARAASLKPDDLPALFDKAEKGDLESQILLGRAYLGAKGTAQDYSKAAAWLRKAADRGHPSAQTILGTMYMSGQGVGKDAGAAVSWFRKAAEQHYAAGEASLGWAYCLGEGVPQNSDEAIQWLLESAEKENALAQVRLGYAYRDGKCAQKDELMAVEWFRKAVAQDDALGQRLLAEMYMSGSGVPQDHAEAVRWYEKAAQAGDALSQFNLGWAYYTGDGLKKDKDLAEKWFSQASDNGSGQASYYIAVMYWNGEAGHTSFASLVATDNFAKAAEQRFPPGALALGDIHSSFWKSARGRVPRDTVTACAWYMIADELDRKSGWDKEFSQIAAKFKNELTDKLSSIQRRLKPEESSSCQVRKNEWVKAHSSSFAVD
jgi:TPR repeat protein